MLDRECLGKRVESLAENLRFGSVNPVLYQIGDWYYYEYIIDKPGIRWTGIKGEKLYQKQPN